MAKVRGLDRAGLAVTLPPSSVLAGGAVVLGRGGADAAGDAGERLDAEPTTLHRGGDQVVPDLAGGDRDAFDVLYRRYVRPVFALALRRLGDRGRAEDATQETFASVWRSACMRRR